MNGKTLAWIGILGVSLFSVASLIGGFQFENYNSLSQFISETYAEGTPYGTYLRYFGFIPSGLLLTVFGFLVPRRFPKSYLIRIGFWGIGLFYGVATMIAGIFPCDKGCNKELLDPSISQIIHNLSGLLTYSFVPLSIMTIGVGLWRLKGHLRLSKIAFLCGLNCLVFVCILLADPLTNYAGLYQRIIEATFIVWILVCALYIKGNDQIRIESV